MKLHIVYLCLFLNLFSVSLEKSTLREIFLQKTYDAFYHTNCYRNNVSVNGIYGQCQKYDSQCNFIGWQDPSQFDIDLQQETFSEIIIDCTLAIAAIVCLINPQVELAEAIVKISDYFDNLPKQTKLNIFQVMRRPILFPWNMQALKTELFKSNSVIEKQWDNHSKVLVSALRNIFDSIDTRAGSDEPDTVISTVQTICYEGIIAICYICNAADLTINLKSEDIDKCIGNFSKEELIVFLETIAYFSSYKCWCQKAVGSTALSYSNSNPIAPLNTDKNIESEK